MAAEERQGGGALSPDPAAGSDQPNPAREARHFPCPQCGADLEYWIGQEALRCGHCAYNREIEFEEEDVVEEQDYVTMLERLEALRRAEDKEEGGQGLEQVIACESCSAEVTFTGALTATECAYCGTPLQRDGVHTADDRIPVDAVLAFEVDKATAQTALKRWLKRLWFAPGSFKKQGARGRFEGVYLPFWTFDALSFTRYRGQRGVNRIEKVGRGKNARTRVKTDWHPASGKFQHFLDDVLLLAARRADSPLLRRLEPWPLQKCRSFKPEFLAGFVARTYDTEIAEGFTQARALMEQTLRSETRRRIGGDTQRITDFDVRYDAITYKHLLLPLWLMSYRYSGRTFQVVINAVTGQVYGERPWSAWKIVFTVLGALAAILIFVGIRAALG